MLQEGHTDSKAEPQMSIDEPQEEEVKEVAELSLNSMVGLSTPRTMKVKGKIAQHEVVVLIDYGAIDNFISTKLVQELELPLECTSGYGILMGTGTTIKGKGLCRGVIFTLQNIEIVEDFLPLELGSANVILGMQWLESLGGNASELAESNYAISSGGSVIDFARGSQLQHLCGIIESLVESNKAARRRSFGGP